MFVGDTGVGRIVRQTANRMADAGVEDPSDAEAVRRLGVIDLPLIQRKLNLHYSLTLDLFGSEQSTNAANFFNSGLKGRFREDQLDDDHRLHGDTYPVLRHEGGGFRSVEVPALQALNARLRDDFVEDCRSGLRRWNRAIAEAGIDFELRLPHIAFNRQIGEFNQLRVGPGGEVLDDATWEAHRAEWLPTTSDAEAISALMRPVTEPGAFASWIAPPRQGVGNKPIDFEYVQIP